MIHRFAGALICCLLAAAPLQAAESAVNMLFDEQDTIMSATESKRELGQAPAVVTVITEKQIRDMGARTLIEVLESVPGMEISYPTDMATGHTLTVRGLKTTEAEKTLLLINGHRVNNPYSGSWTFLFDEFPMDDVRRIEIIRGPGSALYGSNAMAAVIHIITRNADDFTGSDMAATAGNRGYIGEHLTTGVKSDNGNLMVSLNGAKTNGDRQFIARDAAGRSGFGNFWRRQQQGFLSASTGDWSLFAMHISKKRGTVLDGTNQIDTMSNVKLRQSIATLTWQQQHDIWDLSLRSDVDLFSLDPLWQLFGGARLVQPSVKNLTLTESGQLRYRGWQDQEWTFDLSLEHIRQYDVRNIVNGQDLTATQNHNRNTTRNTIALAIQDEWMPLDTLTATAGVRLEHYSDVDNHASPRLALVWNATDTLNLKLMYGHAFRAPNFIELYSANNPAILGNPLVDPETVDTYEIGAALQHESWHLDGNLYYSHYKNLITRLAGNPQTVNIGSETLKGFETELRVDARKGLYGSLSYTWQTGRSSLSSGNLPNVPTQIIKLSGDAPLPMDAHIHADLHWISAQQRAAGDTRPPLPATWLADLAIRAGNPSDGLSMSFVVNNIFNHTVYSPVANPTQSDIPFHDRDWFLNLAWAF